MFDGSEPPSPSHALVAIAPLEPEWQPILHVSNQVVLYNPTSHALSIRTQTKDSSPALARRNVGDRCPYCHRWMTSEVDQEQSAEEQLDSAFEDDEYEGHLRTRAADYFHLLEMANDTASRPASPRMTSNVLSGGHLPQNGQTERMHTDHDRTFRVENMAEGYFKAFFKEECRLGMGANGSVFLCQVSLASLSRVLR